jgi:hypothetical protein
VRLIPQAKEAAAEPGTPLLEPRRHVENDAAYAWRLKVASQLIIGLGRPEIDEAYGNWKVKVRRIAPCVCRESCKSPKTCTP